MTADRAAGPELSAEALLRPRLALLAWLSPAFPVGAYAYSRGLEWAAEQGDVRDEASLEGWLSSLLSDGVGRSDGIILAASWRAGRAADDAALREANELALALAPSSELLLETAQQGRSFLDAVLATWPEPRLAVRAEVIRDIAYPVALGLAASCHEVPLRDVVGGYLTALAGNLVSAAIRLAPVGQTAGQRILARLVPRIADLAESVLLCDLDDVGSATFRADLGSLRHETQYTRLFRS
jgi:urease accessory protein